MDLRPALTMSLLALVSGCADSSPTPTDGMMEVRSDVQNKGDVLPMDADVQAPTVDAQNPDILASLDADATIAACNTPRDSGPVDRLPSSDSVDAGEPDVDWDADVGVTVTFPIVDIDALYPDGAFDDSGVPRCQPGTIVDCACENGHHGLQPCNNSGVYENCTCPTPPAGLTVLPPRLLAPLSATRVTSQRPTLRWVLPDGVTRARVELCADRPCVRMLVQQELTGTSWRPMTRLSPGMVFWRVHGLDAGGAVTWTSTTWEFVVRHRDTDVDSSYGRLRDFNGDGYDDLVVMRTEGVEGFYEGILDIYLGSGNGLRERPSITLTIPDEEREHARLIEVSLGDVNGDGYLDLAATAIARIPNDAACHAGIYLYFGSPSGPSNISPSLVRNPDPIGHELFGEDLYPDEAVILGDVDGDGLDDLIVNAYPIGSSLDEHQYVYRGQVDGPVRLPSYLNRGPVLATRILGDMNGDGYVEALGRGHGSFTDLYYFIYGGPDLNLGLRTTRLTDRSDEHWQATSANLNGDRFTDLVVARRCAGNCDVFGMFGTPEGPVSDASLSIPEDDWWPYNTYRFHEVELIAPLGTAGDLNGDGYSDLALGSTCYPSTMMSSGRGCLEAGRVYIFQGRSDGFLTRPIRVMNGNVDHGPTEFFTASIPGDFNADGYDDLIVSANDPVLGPVTYVFNGGSLEWTMPTLRIRRGPHASVIE